MKEGITISLAQVPVVKGDVQANIEKHIVMVEHSALSNADVVVFPELSLTGYELELAQKLASQPEPSRFEMLSKAAVDNQIIVIAGCPLVNSESDKPTIGAAICFPNGAVEFYSKQYLHEGEDKYCSSGNIDYSLTVNGYILALAICADFVNPEHAKRASLQGADIYLVSALISRSGFDTDAKILSNIAAKHSFPVLLSNHISITGGWESSGSNTIWDEAGQPVFTSGSISPCLVIYSFSGHQNKNTATKVDVLL